MYVTGSYLALKICPEELKFLLHWELGVEWENVLVGGISSP